MFLPYLESPLCKLIHVEEEFVSASPHIEKLGRVRPTIGIVRRTPLKSFHEPQRIWHKKSRFVKQGRFMTLFHGLSLSGVAGGSCRYRH
jgi:hypothetical protein